MLESWAFNLDFERRRERLRSKRFNTYCLFCKTGKEIRLAKELNKMHNDALALPFMRMMHKSVNGERSLVQDVILKSYVFLYLPEEKDIEDIHVGKVRYQILGFGKNKERELTGKDRRYSEWVLSYGGIIEASKALREGERVKIVAGPLLELEGDIVKYSKKNRNCRIEIKIVGQEINVWLPFTWVEPQDDDTYVYGEE